MRLSVMNFSEAVTYSVQPILVFDFFETAVAVVLTDNFEIVMLKCGKIHKSLGWCDKKGAEEDPQQLAVLRYTPTMAVVEP